MMKTINAIIDHNGTIKRKPLRRCVELVPDIFYARIIGELQHGYVWLILTKHGKSFCLSNDSHFPGLFGTKHQIRAAIPALKESIHLQRIACLDGLSVEIEEETVQHALAEILNVALAMVGG